MTRSTTTTTAILVAAAFLPTAIIDAFVPPQQQQLTTTTATTTCRVGLTTTTLLKATPEHAPAQASASTAAEEEDQQPIYFDILTADETAPKQQPTSSVSADSPSELSDVALAASAKISDSYTAINGWVPKEDYALWGLPGAIAPLGYFDPLGFARQGLTLNDAKRMREAEVMHGRVAMLAVVGYLSQEAMNAVGGGGPFHLTGPANDQLQQVPTIPFAVLTLAIASAELYRASKGWVEPEFRIGSGTLWTLRDSYYPGDLGFDPLGLKPTENYAFQKMQTKELSNGRLAMIGWAGICAQELINHKTIGDTYDFYSHLFAGDYNYY